MQHFEGSASAQPADRDGLLATPINEGSGCERWSCRHHRTSPVSTRAACELSRCRGYSLMRIQDRFSDSLGGAPERGWRRSGERGCK
jgi:hypothetical protein